MANQKHLTALDRITIENSLKNNDSFKAIAKKLDKDCTTISKEIRNHYRVMNTGSVGRRFNNCLYRRSCLNRGKTCVISNCINFKEENVLYLINLPMFVLDVK